MITVKRSLQRLLILGAILLPAAVRIAAAAPSDVVVGTIRSVDQHAKTITISVAGKSDPQTLTLGAKCAIVVNGTTARMAALQPGQRATLSLDPINNHIIRLRVFDSGSSDSSSPSSSGEPGEKAKTRTIAANQPGGSTGNEEYRLDVAPSKKIHAVYDFSVTIPGLAPSEWIVYAPVPPLTTGQQDLKATLLPRSREVREHSPLRRKLLLARIPAAGDPSAARFSARAEYEATLFSRHLVRTRTSLKPTDRSSAATASQDLSLGAADRSSALGKRGLVDPKSPALAKWLEKNHLERRDAEGEIDYAHRVFVALVHDFTYEFSNRMDRRLDSICTRMTSDCGGLSLTFVAAMRREGIPARVLVGRWAESAGPGRREGDMPHYQSHVKCEFFANGVGWVPVDCALAVIHDKPSNGERFFGNDAGDFLTLHIDPDLELDTIHFGTKKMSWANGGLPFWVKGHGSAGAPQIKEDWKVEERSPK